MLLKFVFCISVIFCLGVSSGNCLVMVLIVCCVLVWVIFEVLVNVV